jgi:hypothetical protein
LILLRFILGITPGGQAGDKTSPFGDASRERRA